MRKGLFLFVCWLCLHFHGVSLSQARFSFSSFTDISMLQLDNARHSQARPFGPRSHGRALSLSSPRSSVFYQFPTSSPQSQYIDIFSSFTYSYTLQSSDCVTISFSADNFFSMTHRMCSKPSQFPRTCVSTYSLSSPSNSVSKSLSSSCTHDKHIQIRAKHILQTQTSDQAKPAQSRISLYVEDLITPILTTDSLLLSSPQRIGFHSQSNISINLWSWSFQSEPITSTERPNTHINSNTEQCDIGFISQSLGSSTNGVDVGISSSTSGDGNCIPNPIVSLRACPGYTNCAACSSALHDCSWCSQLGECIGGAARHYCPSSSDWDSDTQANECLEEDRLSFILLGIVFLFGIAFILLSGLYRHISHDSRQGMVRLVSGAISGLVVAFIVNAILIQMDEEAIWTSSGLLAVFILASHYFHQHCVSHRKTHLERLCSISCMFAAFLCLQVAFSGTWKAHMVYRVITYFGVSFSLSLLVIYVSFLLRLGLFSYIESRDYKLSSYSAFVYLGTYTPLSPWMVCSAFLSAVYFATSFGSIDAEEASKRNFFLEHEYRNLFYPVSMVAGMMSTFFMPRHLPTHDPWEFGEIIH